MAIVELTIIPIGTTSTSLSAYVANMQEVLAQTKEPISYQMTPMSTIIEGELDDLFKVISRLHELPFQNGAQRVSTSIKIDDRRDQPSSMQQKMKSVETKLGL
ncbi:uncharacterized protein, MTH1187 family [Paenibacillus sp. 1_12]|uniref:MTH1187 family thiamine-binding protein n=1 Tax=Paenibacillus sp. 1_12 TaxID=1566278 RepID=UPI0008EE19D2|nr:MTH1187 family thiamine-binding protein [Paenibacillus sp. 1_12]SFM24315.1 uncharacterized protein, MTH1187 family [Paenibacillus sp. 1_12]